MYKVILKKWFAFYNGEVQPGDVIKLYLTFIIYSFEPQQDLILIDTMYISFIT